MISFTNIKNKTLWVCITAVFMGINILMSSFGVPVPGGRMYLNDVIICVSSLVLDPVTAMLVGGIGAFLGDFFFYPAPMWVSLVTHGLQAAVISLIAHKVLRNRRFLAGAIGVAVGAVIMIVGYTLGRAFIYSTPQYAIIKLPFQILQAVFGAVAGWIIVFPLGIGRLFGRHVEIYGAKNNQSNNKI